MMKYRLKFDMSPSAWVSALLISGIVFFRFVYPPVNILSWDVFGYYLYLPATFIYNDLKINDINWVNQIISHYQTTSTLYQATALPEGGWVMKYSMGMALLNAPSFLIAHAISFVSGYKPDGFTLPYQYAWAINGLIVTAIGILMLRKILLLFFSEKISIILLFIVVLATNYFQLTAFDGYLSHNYTFTLYTIIVWFTIKWHSNPNRKNAVALGLSMGLVVLVRPSELVCIFIPLLWGIHNTESFLQKIHFLKKHSGGFGMVILAAIAGGFPQLVYWKYATGHWIYYSYNNAGEGFDFSNPYLPQVLFSFRKGWLIYTPVMIFALEGFISLFRNNKAAFYTVLVYFLINLYIVSSWTCWWYAGGSYSQRALLSSYVLLALPLGYLLTEIQGFNKWVKSAVALIISILLAFNLFQTWQWATGILDKTRMTKEYYFATLLKTEVTEADRQLLLIERPTDANEKLKNESKYSKRTAMILTFDDSSDQNLSLNSDTAFEGKASLKLTKQHPFSPALEMAYSEITSKDHAWIRLSAMVFPTVMPDRSKASMVVTFTHEGENYSYKALNISLNEFNIKPGQWNQMQMDYLTPEVRSVEDKMKAYFWLEGEEPVFIDNLKFEIFD